MEITLPSFAKRANSGRRSNILGSARLLPASCGHPFRCPRVERTLLRLRKREQVKLQRLCCLTLQRIAVEKPVTEKLDAAGFQRERQTQRAAGRGAA